MQTLDLVQDDYDTKFLFLYELINIFTRNLEIKNRAFYYKINSDLKHNPILRGLSYNEEGLLHFDAIFENYKKAKKAGRVVYQIAPYLSCLSRLLSLIYTQASNILGEEKAEKILKESFDLAEKKYREIPDLEGYIPEGISRKKVAKETMPFSIAMMDSLIEYLAKNIIAKK